MLRRTYSTHFLWGQKHDRFVSSSILPRGKSGSFTAPSAVAAAAAADSFSSKHGVIAIRDPSQGSLALQNTIPAVLAEQATLDAASKFNLQQRRRQQPAVCSSGNIIASSLRRFATELEKAGDVLAKAESLNTGLPLRDSIACVNRAVEWFHFCADWRTKNDASFFISSGNNNNNNDLRDDPSFSWRCHRQPLGTVVLLTPFQHSLATGLFHTAAALAAGNAVIWKPSIHAPLSAAAVATVVCPSVYEGGGEEEEAKETMQFQILQGAADVGDFLVSSPKVHAVSFVGNARHAGRIKEVAARTNMKRCFCVAEDLGTIVLSDPAKLDRAVECAVNAFRHSGQNPLLSPRRALVSEQLLVQFLEALAKRAQDPLWQVGHALDAKVHQGPMRDAAAKCRIVDAVKKAVTHKSKRTGEIADLVFGGFPISFEARDGGVSNFVAPTCVCGVPEDAELWREWIPGPLLCVRSFADGTAPEDVAADINKSARFGGRAFLFCNDGVNERLEQLLHVGSVVVCCSTNDRSDEKSAPHRQQTPIDSFEVPHQPCKISGDGATWGGVEMIEQFLRKKTIVRY